MYKYLESHICFTRILMVREILPENTRSQKLKAHEKTKVIIMKNEMINGSKRALFDL